MTSIVICGAGIVGLCTAMMAARDGHEVTVLESDPSPVPVSPQDAWDSWARAGVAQFRQPHIVFARARRILDEELPGVTRQLLEDGCLRFDFLHPMPPGIPDRQERPGDEAFRTVTGRRPVVEAAVARLAAAEPRATVRRGVTVERLLPGTPVAGVPRVAGVRTTMGEDLGADLVVDATGRRSHADTWIDRLGGTSPEDRSESSGFVYYTRYFHATDMPQRRAPALTPMGTFSLLTLPADDGTWSVTVFGPSRDAALKAVRDPELFSRVVRACPAHAHWLEGEPIGNVVAMAGILDRHRRFVVAGRPVVTGFAAVGDAWASTNPSAGRGISIGLVHAQLLRRVIRDHLDDPMTFAEVWDRETEAQVAPFYRNQVAADRARLAEMDALRAGEDPPLPQGPMTSFLTAAGHDADVFRGLIETITCLALPQEVLARPEIREAIERFGDGAPTAFPGPDREQLLQLLA
jgi:2-polyprenyl-6-methoxyphenol hydroxylase-like FAD-dependent oxidoreductase